MAKEPEAPISAKVEAIAKATYARMTTWNINETIPEDVTRAQASAWLDAISPVTEWLGMRGDILRDKREQLAIQRHRTMTEIAERFVQARPSDAPLDELPPKFLVPFIEQASLEDADSPLVGLWSNLLVSAAEQYDPSHLHFMKIISSLSPSQAKVFSTMFRGRTLHELDLGLDDVDGFFALAHFQKGFAQQLGKAKPKDNDEFGDCIVEHMNTYAVQVLHVAFDRDEYADIGFPYPTAQDKDELDLAILESLGLISKVSTPFLEYTVGDLNWEMTATYFHLRRLGLAFARACKMFPEE